MIHPQRLSFDLMMWAGLYHLYLTLLPVRQFMQGVADD
jgi:hypothetical protein